MMDFIHWIDKASIHNYIQEAINAARQIDVLRAGTWCPNMEELYKWFSPSAILVGTGYAFGICRGGTLQLLFGIKGKRWDK